MYKIHGSGFASVSTAGSSSSDATQLTRDSDWTVVLVTGTANQGVILPSNSQVGDLFELHTVYGSTSTGWIVYPYGSETLNTGSSLNLYGTGNALLRKATSTAWVNVCLSGGEV